jgi:hypothetical protein
VVVWSVSRKKADAFEKLCSYFETFLVMQDSVYV